MNSTLSLLTLLGSIALSLYGMMVMSQGILKVAGSQMRASLRGITNHSLHSLLTGTWITAIIQSSSAMTLMAVGLANTGMITLSQSIALTMGANVGTTLTGWLLALFGYVIDVRHLAIPLIVLALPFYYAGRLRLKSWGEILMGISMFVLGFTLFVDDVDAGETLKHFKGFRGEASGKLHGKVKLFVKEGGRALRLGDAFLYSTPGEVGKLRMADAAPVTDNLALAGIDNATRANVADALTDLDYSVLRLNLKPDKDKTATLSTTIRGTATRGRTSVPVDITLNFNGELEQLINTGLGYSNLLKGKQK